MHNHMDYDEVPSNFGISNSSELRVNRSAVKIGARMQIGSRE